MIVLERTDPKRSRRKTSRVRIGFRVRFVLPEKPSRLQPSISQSASGFEFPILRAVLQSQVRLEQPVDQLAFLFLSIDARDEQEDEQGGEKPAHASQADETMSFL